MMTMWWWGYLGPQYIGDRCWCVTQSWPDFFPPNEVASIHHRSHTRHNTLLKHDSASQLTDWRVQYKALTHCAMCIWLKTSFVNSRPFWPRCGLSENGNKMMAGRQPSIVSRWGQGGGWVREQIGCLRPPHRCYLGLFATSNHFAASLIYQGHG